MENNENPVEEIKSTEEIKPKKSRKLLYFTIALGVIVIFFGYIMWVLSEDKVKLNKKVNEYEQLHSQESYTIDSSFQVIRRLSIYRELSEAMVYCDSVWSFLPHNVGDIVYSKLDSTKYILEDIITGGTKYSYYVKFKVRSKDKVEEIDPVLIY